MSDNQGSSPFSGFAGLSSSSGMFDKMWDMMRLTPFGGLAASPGAAAGLPPSLSAMSDMLGPLTNVEELDKRITDLRAVEQWLKLNLGMLQSAIQALEVQRATLATLRAFGAFARTSMQAAEAAVSPQPAADDVPQEPAAKPWPFADIPKRTAADPEPAPQAAEAAAPEPEAARAPAGGEESAEAAFDPSGWWNLLQTQFNQLASLAMSQAQAAAAAAGESPAPAAPAKRKSSASRAKAAPGAAKRTAKPAGAAKTTGSTTAARASTARKTVKREV